MCEFSEAQRKAASVKYFSNHPDSMIARSVTERFPNAFRPNCCPCCGKRLQPWEQRYYGSESVFPFLVEVEASFRG